MYNYLLYFDIKTGHTLFTSSSVLNETCMLLFTHSDMKSRYGVCF